MRDEIRNEKLQGQQQQQSFECSFTELTDEQLKGVYGGAGAFDALFDGQNPLGNVNLAVSLPAVGSFPKGR